MKRKIRNFGGPGALIAAAFIGPGTITVCTLAGASYGFELLWAMGVSIAITIILQEMAARLGIITRLDLSSLIKREIKSPVLKTLTVILVFSAIVIGNAAYEAGNISGGVMGLITFFPVFSGLNVTPAIVGSIAFVLLWSGSYKVLEKALVTLVVLMSFSFVVTAVMTKPDLSALMSGLLVPRIPGNSLLMVIGLVGTTVVPYNLFLHASLAKNKWTDKQDVKTARKDTVISVLAGGLISISIIISARALNPDIESAADLAHGLEPVYGAWARQLLSIGLFAAGITSAITAPLAAAYVASGCFGWSSDMRSVRFRSIWSFILITGVLFSSIGFKPIDIIHFAQVTNGLLLPVIGFVLVWLCSKERILGTYKNSAWMTTFGALLLVLVTLLGIRSIWVLL